jgi:hypothetical protein
VLTDDENGENVKQENTPKDVLNHAWKVFGGVLSLAGGYCD